MSLGASFGGASHPRSVSLRVWGALHWVRPSGASTDPEGEVKKKISLRGFWGARPSGASPDPRVGPGGGAIVLSKLIIYE